MLGVADLAEVVAPLHGESRRRRGETFDVVHVAWRSRVRRSRFECDVRLRQ
jgi:hypothetical protein